MSENGLLTQSRLILLDSPLLIFTAFTAFAFTCFTNQHEQGPAKAFTPAWWLWLAATGIGLGATASVKWVGLFTIAWVGSLTALQLWVLLGDAKTVTPVRAIMVSEPPYLLIDMSEIMAQAPFCSCFLPDCHPNYFLPCHVRNTFPLPGQSR